MRFHSAFSPGQEAAAVEMAVVVAEGRELLAISLGDFENFGMALPCCVADKGRTLLFCRYLEMSNAVGKRASLDELFGFFFT
jgi:hypothetical protein